MMHERRLMRPLVVGGMVGLVGALGFLSGAFVSWSDRVTDRFFLVHEPDPAITIVAIDDASITRIGRWPWDRAVHAQLINALTEAGAVAVGYDVNFPEPQDELNDAALAEALRRSGKVVLPIELSLTITSNTLTFNPGASVVAISRLAAAAARTGHANPSPDTDGVVRRVPLSVSSPDGSSSINAFSMELAALVGRLPTDIPHDSLGRTMINFNGPARATFRTIPAADVIQGSFDPSAAAGKIVLVGSTAPDLHDEQITPTSYGVPMPGVEIHASLLDTLLRERWLVPVPAWTMVILLLVLGLLAGLIIPRVRTRWSGLLFLTLWFGLFFCAFLLFDRGWIMNVVWPSLVLAAGYGAVTLERRMAAERERRELKNAFSRYVSPSVVDSILRDPTKLRLGGERKRMTVLFSDIRGFTSISEKMGPDELVQVLNIYLDRMTNIVFESEGVLDKYIGDAVMAFWNAPFDQSDHALRGVRAALTMRDALAEMNEAKAFGDIDLHIGIGVNTGEMVVGNVGGQVRFDYTVIGDNVNLASRLESLTKEYGVQIILTEAARKEIGKEILTRRLDKVAVKGKKEPVLIHEAMDLAMGASKARKQLAKDFEAALDTYFARDFSGAAAACDALLATYPDDGPSKTLKERAAHFIDEPPPEDWVGTWVYTKK